jgi:hypothetical protein
MSRFGSQGSLVCPYVQTALSVPTLCGTTQHQSVSSTPNTTTTGPDRPHAMAGTFPPLSGSKDARGDGLSRIKYRIRTGARHGEDDPRCVSGIMRPPLEQVPRVLVRLHREIH